jgi:hypothetical protein
MRIANRHPAARALDHYEHSLVHSGLEGNVIKLNLAMATHTALQSVKPKVFFPSNLLVIIES